MCRLLRCKPSIGRTYACPALRIEQGAMGLARARPADAAEIAPSVSRQRFGAAACRTSVSFAVAEAGGSGKLRPAHVHLEGGCAKVRKAANRAEGSFGQGALLGAACRVDPSQRALHISCRS